MTVDIRTRHCVEPAVDAANLKTGRDIWAELGGCPRSWKEAADLYRKLGARNLSEAVTAVLGESVDPRKARRGDIAMVRGALGICRGEMVECLGATVPLREAERAWHVC